MKGNRIRIASLLACALCLTIHAAEATTIVVLARGEDLYLGVDSRTVVGLGANPRSRETCKIHQYNDVLVAMAGQDHPQAGLDFGGKFTEASRNWKGTFDEKAATLERLGRDEYRRFLQQILDQRATAEEQVRSLEQLGRSELASPAEQATIRELQLKTRAKVDLATEVLKQITDVLLVVVGVERGKARIAIRSIERTIVDRTAAPTVKVIPFTDFTMLATNSAYLKMTPLRRAQIRSLPPAVAIQMFIEEQIRETPASVGPPVNVVKIGRTGSEWMRSSAACNRQRGL